MTKCFLWGDFNAEEASIHIKDFCNLYTSWKTWSKFSCFTNPNNLKTIDLMLINSVRSFQNSYALETGFCDFPQTTVTVLKLYLEKKQPKIIFYRDFGKFSNNDFRTQILRDFSTLRFSNESPFLDLHVDICIRALDIYAPKKKKC